MLSQAPFSDRLVALMADRGIGVPTLAKRTGISERMIFRYRSGATEPRTPSGKPTPYAYALAQALGVDVDELIERPEALAS